jgi:hypothetical protein
MGSRTWETACKLDIKQRYTLKKKEKSMKFNRILSKYFFEEEIIFLKYFKKIPLQLFYLTN